MRLSKVYETTRGKIIVIAIVCLDQNNGMYFNERRQSRDRYVVRDILEMTKDSVLHINSYSEDLFENQVKRYMISDDYFSDAKEDEYCFVENHILDQSAADQLIVYRWDKVYPADHRLNLEKWRMVSKIEFMGYSHDTIIKEVYEKNDTEK